MIDLIKTKRGSIGQKVKPESAIMSASESPFLAKAAVRLARDEVGGGICLFAFAKLAVLESLLPSFTSQFGPPNSIIL